MAKIELGKKYVTCKGEIAEVISIDANKGSDYSVVALIGEKRNMHLYTSDGQFWHDKKSVDDLQEAPPPLKFPQFKRGDLVIVHNSNRTGFVRVFSHSDGRYAYTFTNVYDGKCEVLAHWHNCEPFIPPEV